MSRIDAEKKISSKISRGKPKFTPLTIIIIVFTTIFIIGGVAVYAMLGSGSKTVDASSYNHVVTPENVKQIRDELETAQKTALGSYEVYMNTTWTFKDASSPSTDAIVGNKATNTNTVYFTISLKDDSSQVFKSPYIPVGNNLEHIVLDESLKAGTYPAVITYYLVDDNYVEQSHVSVNMTLSILN